MKYTYLSLAIISYLFMLTANFFSTRTSIDWLSMGDLSQTFPFDYMPPGIAFAISWGLIYLLMTIYILSLIYRVRNSYTESTKQEIFYYTGINVLNISWILSTANDLFVLAAGIIFALFALLSIFLKKFGHDIYKNVGFGIYLGWITVASFGLSTAQLMYLAYPNIALSFEFGNFILFFSAIVAGGVYYKLKNPYALTWALLAIIVTALKFYGIINF